MSTVYKIPGTALEHADVPLAALPAVREVPADGVSDAPLPGSSLYQVAHRFYARAQ